MFHLSVLFFLGDTLHVWHNPAKPLKGYIELGERGVILLYLEVLVPYQLHSVALLGVGSLPPVLGHPGSPRAQTGLFRALLGIRRGFTDAQEYLM